ncbi:sigma-70 family RNA polymerase sigma factor [Chitinophaga filiformis]|uniref:RNA polymerase sigma factor n=1 Tax=Chitinophaga filiformis TaxID=104663 RepID=UPI001F46B581|nr:sigma-70 family RNA polymerase sigma factor [Chitinophaga filiformis]MCF6407520.1 sigma-70 family RNA polymerase sigma factor [Chitinophaga filiformis]
MNDGATCYKDELLNQLVNNDEKALKKIICLYHHKLVCKAVLILNDIEEAREVVNDVFLKLWDVRCSLRNDTVIGRYLFTLTKNASISALRKRAARDVKKSAFEYVQPTFVNENPLENAEMGRHINTAIQSLPGVQKRVFCSLYIEGKSISDVMQEQNIEMQTARNTLSIAVKKLRTKLYPLTIK